jgi:N-acetylglucosaminyl-diphospho-decaprenol L-rhamnosyltransferase
VIYSQSNPATEISAKPVDIAFLTVSYNTLQSTQQLASFFSSLEAPFTFSFTVVDNASHDGSQEFLRSHPEIHYLQTGENLGYGRAINRAVAATESKYICVTNTDVTLNREALISLWDFMEQHADAGLCAPRIFYEDGRDQGMAFHASLFSQYAEWYAKRWARSAKRKIATAAEPVKVEGVMGAFFLIRRSVVPTQTLFDEDFFLFYEDTALSHSLLNRGVSCFVVPDATIIHLGGKSGSKSSVARFYESKYLYLQKFYGPAHARAIYYLDRARILRKWLLYSLFSLFNASERVQNKRRYYKVAWKGAHRE